MKTLILIFLLLLFIVPFSVHETLRFFTAHQVCTRVYAQNALLLANDLCNDPWQRHLHGGGKQEKACRLAHEENLVGPLACAWRKLWLESEPFKLWAMVTSSYWLLTAVIVSTACTAIYMAFQSCNQQRALKMQENMYLQTMAMVHGNGNRASVLGIQHQAPPQYRLAQKRQTRVEEEEGDFIELVNV
jgi:hypothetical protein